jgi:hypothetical protein
MTDVSRLPPKERAAHFRRLAEDAAKFAKSSTGPIRQSYELIAEQWLKLAEEIETQLSRP